jgi:protein-disulfide isomerase
MAPYRRLSLVLFALVAAAGLSAASAAPKPAPQPVMAEEMSLGNPKAKVTVIEYASASCPHCARFSNEVFEAFKAKYVDTGKVRYVFREFLTPPEQFAAKYGMSKEDMTACTSDEKAVQALNDRVTKAQKDGVNATPTFLIGETKIEGEKPLADLSAVIDPMLAK